jgi:hypothetical protein
MKVRGQVTSHKLVVSVGTRIRLASLLLLKSYVHILSRIGLQNIVMTSEFYGEVMAPTITLWMAIFLACLFCSSRP